MHKRLPDLRHIAIHLFFGLMLSGVANPAMALNPIQIENAIPPVATDYQWDWH